MATLTLTAATLTAVTRTIYSPRYTPSLFTAPPLKWQVHQAAVHSCLCDNFNTAGAMSALLATCSDANSYVKVPYLSKSPYLGTVRGVGIFLGAL